MKGEYIDKILDYAKFLNYYTKEDILQLVAQKFENENHEKFVIGSLKDGAVTNKAFEIAKKHNLVQKYCKEMEEMLKLKTPEVRKNLINLLYLQKKTAFYESVENLIKTKDVNKRLAAFDLILKAKNEKKDDMKTLKKYVKLVKEPTSSEIVLISEINREEKKAVNEELKYNINYEPSFENKEFLEKKLDIKQIFTKSIDELLEIVKKLNDLYVKYENCFLIHFLLFFLRIENTIMEIRNWRIIHWRKYGGNFTKQKLRILKRYISCIYSQRKDFQQRNI